MLAIDAVRLFVGVSILAFASWTDWRWRRAPNILWIVMAASAAVLLALQIYFEPEILRQTFYLVFIPIFAGMMYAFYRVHLIAGGADMKALAALSLLLPFPVRLLPGLPIATSALPGSFATFGNALVAFLFLPLALLLWNATRGGVRLPHAFVAYRMPIDEVPRRHVWPHEIPDESGKLKFVMFPSRWEWEPSDFETVKAAGVTHLWVTPKVPFMIPLLIGFVLTFFYGDALFSLVFRFVRGG
jgi:archaeal preflagellin peptidase FlaK